MRRAAMRWAARKNRDAASATGKISVSATGQSITPRPSSTISAQMHQIAPGTLVSAAGV